MSEHTNIWIFSNYWTGYYQDSDWDISTILKTNHYYFNDKESNRSYVKTGDIVLFRTYSQGFWGTCKIASAWVDDKDWKAKHENKTGWFEIDNIKKWKMTLPYEIIKTELSNQNHRLRIARATKEDYEKIEFALRLYSRFGYGSTDGEFFILENGLEEAVKKNLSQLKLRLASGSIQQQCSLEIGVGRTDLICLDEKDNYVVIELKVVDSSDVVIGQIQRYMGYIQENWAEKENKQVKGIIIAPSYNEGLRLAAKAAGIKVLRLRIG